MFTEVQLSDLSKLLNQISETLPTAIQRRASEINQLAHPSELSCFWSQLTDLN